MHRLYLSATWPGDPGAYQQALLAFGSAIKRLFIFLPLLMVACIAASSFLSPSARRRGFTIEDTISRANRVIAIDRSDKPLYRWVFTTPEDYTAVTDAGAIAKHDPAQVSYGMGWTNPSPEHSDTVYTDLTDDEWQRVEQWQQTWCQAAPALRPLKQDERFYIVALRCYKVITFRVPQDQLPADIAVLLHRVSEQRVSPSPSE